MYLTTAKKKINPVPKTAANIMPSHSIKSFKSLSILILFLIKMFPNGATDNHTNGVA